MKLMSSEDIKEPRIVNEISREDYELMLQIIDLLYLDYDGEVIVS